MTKAEKQHLNRVAALGCIELEVSGKTVVMDVEDALMFAGIAMFVGTNGYAQVRRSAKTRFVHRVIAGAQGGELVGHVNGNPLDNRRCNLRVCSDSQNNMNKRLRSNNSTGISGVWWDERRMKWAVQIAANGERKNIGRFEDLFSAVAARRSAELLLHGSFSATLGVLA